MSLSCTKAYETSHESILIEINKVLGFENIDSEHENSVAVHHLDTNIDFETRPNISTGSPEIADDEDEDGYMKPSPAPASIMTDALESIDAESSHYEIVGTAESKHEDSVVVPHLDASVDSERGPNIPMKSHELTYNEDDDGYLKPSPAADAIMIDTSEIVENMSSYYEPVGIAH